MNDINVGNIVKFSQKYEGELFLVVDKEDQNGADHDHVWLECLTNKFLQIDTYVDTTDLVKADGRQSR